MPSASSSQPWATLVWGFYFSSTGVGSPEVRDAKARSLLAGNVSFAFCFLLATPAPTSISTMGPVVGCTAGFQEGVDAGCCPQCSLRTGRM